MSAPPSELRASLDRFEAHASSVKEANRELLNLFADLDNQFAAKKLRVYDYLRTETIELITRSQLTFGSCAPLIKRLASSPWRLDQESLIDFFGLQSLTERLLKGLLKLCTHYSSTVTWEVISRELTAHRDIRQASATKRAVVSAKRQWMPRDISAVHIARTQLAAPQLSSPPPTDPSSDESDRESDDDAPGCDDPAQNGVVDTPNPKKRPAAHSFQRYHKRYRPNLAPFPGMEEDLRHSGDAHKATSNVVDAADEQGDPGADSDEDPSIEVGRHQAISSRERRYSSIGVAHSLFGDDESGFTGELHGPGMDETPTADKSRPDALILDVDDTEDEPDQDRQTTEPCAGRLRDNMQLTGADLCILHERLVPAPCRLYMPEVPQGELLAGWAAPNLRPPLNPDECYVAMPVLVNGNHWVLYVFDRSQKLASFYDPLPSLPQAGAEPDQPGYTVAAKVVERLGESWQDDGWRFAVTQNGPRQANNVDCGVFVILTTLYAASGRDAPARYNGRLWRETLAALVSKGHQPRAILDSIASLDHPNATARTTDGTDAQKIEHARSSTRYWQHLSNDSDSAVLLLAGLQHIIGRDKPALTAEEISQALEDVRQMGACFAKLPPVATQHYDLAAAGTAVGEATTALTADLSRARRSANKVDSAQLQRCVDMLLECGALARQRISDASSKLHRLRSELDAKIRELQQARDSCG